MTDATPNFWIEDAGQDAPNDQCTTDEETMKDKIKMILNGFDPNTWNNSNGGMCGHILAALFERLFQKGSGSDEASKTFGSLSASAPPTGVDTGSTFRVMCDHVGGPVEQISSVAFPVNTGGNEGIYSLMYVQSVVSTTNMTATHREPKEWTSCKNLCEITTKTTGRYGLIYLCPTATSRSMEGHFLGWMRLSSNQILVVEPYGVRFNAKPNERNMFPTHLDQYKSHLQTKPFFVMSADSTVVHPLLAMKDILSEKPIKLEPPDQSKKTTK